MKLNTVWRWWDYFRVGLCRKWLAQGVKVRPLPYDELNEKEQDIVYHYWATGRLEKNRKRREAK